MDRYPTGLTRTFGSEGSAPTKGVPGVVHAANDAVAIAAHHCSKNLRRAPMSATARASSLTAMIFPSRESMIHSPASQVQWLESDHKRKIGGL